MKTLLIALVVTAFSAPAFAVQYCTIKGTSNTAGIFPGDSGRDASIYVQGHGYFVITDIDDSYQVYTSKKRGHDTVVLDFKNKTLKMGSETLKLTNCVQNGSE